MVEISSKYKIGTRRFGSVNWIGAWTLYKKEVLRFLNVWIQTISKVNPFFYMIDGFRYSFIEKSDGSLTAGLIYLTTLSFIMFMTAYTLYKKGYKIKS